MRTVFYPDTPKIDLINGTENWTVSENWISQLVLGKAVLVKRGLMTDGASIPRLFWRLIGHPLMGWILPHALAHDGLYMGELMTRSECDRWFETSMRLAGVSWIKRNAIYAAVRLGGWAVWMRHTTDGVNKARKQVALLDYTAYHAYKTMAKIDH